MFLCRVPHIGHSVKPLPSVTSALSKKNPTSTLTASLPSATSAALGKEFFLFFENSLPSVILLHSAKKFFLLKKKKSLASAMALALGKARKLGLCFPALPSAMFTALGKALFAECGTRQRGEKCYFFGFLLSINTNKEITHISTHSTWYITYTSITHHIHIHHP